MSFEIKLEGLDELNAKIAELKDVKKVRSRALSAARKAMKIVELSAKMGAAYIDDPETREDIQKNITTKSGKSRDYATVVMKVGVMGGASMNGRSDKLKLASLPGGNTTHWRYLEFGTSTVPAVPFMRPALSENYEKVTDEFAKTFKKSIESAISKGKLT